MANLIYVSTDSTVYAPAVSAVRMAGWLTGDLPSPPPEWMIINPNTGNVSFSNTDPSGTSTTADSIGDVALNVPPPVVPSTAIEPHEIVIEPVAPFTGTDQYKGRVVFVPENALAR